MARKRVVALFYSTKSDRKLHKSVCGYRIRPPPHFDLISKNQIGGKERMAYIKAKAEKKWKKWKETEEQQLRELGVEEEIIEQLRKADWEDFNEDRRYREHIVDLVDERNTPTVEMQEPDMDTLSVLINAVENEDLLHILLQADLVTLQTILLRVMGYEIKEIAAKMQIPDKTIYTKMDRLKKKIKKVEKL